MISKDKPEKNIQEMNCHKRKKPGHYASQCQLIGSTNQVRGYCRRYGHNKAVCYKKQADESRSKADTDKTKEVFPKTMLKKEVELEAEEEKKPILFVQESETQMAKVEVRMKRMASGKPAQKHTCVYEPLNEGVGRPTFTAIEPKKMKASQSTKKDARQKSAIQVQGAKVERYDFLRSLACTSAGITFGQIANGDVDNVKKDLQKIIT